jgi:hypothetical protein
MIGLLIETVENSNIVDDSDDDGSDSEYSYVGNKSMRTPGTLNDLENKFFDSLPKCTMMMFGFDIGDKGEE